MGELFALVFVLGFYAIEFFSTVFFVLLALLILLVSKIARMIEDGIERARYKPGK